ncbi:EKA homolg [Blumeria hordei DH14]|uniref:EKA homolg n=1 Tax=Blumeria graminis f. sp. hordei (strain DH14) TaxID=546991 RepID=N1J8G9_BLUG1|nr:EKA homolg [Blumeria hordei DH14]
MPPVRKKHLNAKLDNTRVRPRALEKFPGLAQSSKCAKMGKAVSKGKEIALPAVTEPGPDMIGSVEIVEEIPQRASIPHGIGESSKFTPTEPKPSEKAAPIKKSQPQAATKAECPSELRPIVEAEQRRAAETAANLALCFATISGVAATLLPLTNGSN